MPEPSKKQYKQAWARYQSHWMEDNEACLHSHGSTSTAVAMLLDFMLEARFLALARRAKRSHMASPMRCVLEVLRE